MNTPQSELCNCIMYVSMYVCMYDFVYVIMRCMYLSPCTFVQRDTAVLQETCFFLEQHPKTSQYTILLSDLTTDYNIVYV